MENDTETPGCAEAFGGAGRPAASMIAIKAMPIYLKVLMAVSVKE